MSNNDAVMAKKDATEKVVEPKGIVQMTDSQTADAALKDRMEQVEQLRAALMQGDAAKNVAEGENNASMVDSSTEQEVAEKPTLAPESGEKVDAVSEEAQKEIDWKAEVGRIKAEQRKKDGIRGSELEKLRKTVEELNAKLQEKSFVSEKEQKSNVVVPAELAKEPTEEELVEEYGPDYETEIGRELAIRNLKAIKRRVYKAQQDWDKTIDSKVTSKLSEVKSQRQIQDAMDKVESLVPGAIEIDSNADVNGFADYLNEADGDTGFSRKEIAMRIMDNVAQGKSSEALIRRLASIYTGFTGKGSVAQGKVAMREEKSSQSDTSSGNKPDASQYIMPTAKTADRKPEMGSVTTVSSAESELRAARNGNFDEAVKRLLEKARRGEIRAG